MNKKISVAIVGYGLRGSTYAECILQHSGEIEVVAVAEIQPKRLKAAKDLLSLEDNFLFPSAEEFFKHEKMADIAIISTQDRQHFSMARQALNLGYDLLLEKPISPNIKEVIALEKEARALGRLVVVCHVLRYTNFFSAIKQALKSQEIGNLINIMAIENVGYYHQAHSFVRGNWRNSDETSPMILAKCTHDLDYLFWFADSPCQQLSSFGGTSYFKASQAPKGASLRCLNNCAAKQDCPYDAEKIYITNKQSGIRYSTIKWPCNALTEDLTEEGVYKAIKEGPYGRCVFHCDNNVVDNQIVTLNFENGVNATLTMSGFSNEISRYLKLMGSHGDIIADMLKNTITVHPFGKAPRQLEFDHVEENNSGHGGGDEGIIIDLIKSYNNRDIESLSSIGISIQSHIMALAAEESKLSNGKAINLKEFVAQNE